MTIFDNYILVGEDFATLEIYDSNLNLVISHRFTQDKMGVRDMVIMQNTASKVTVAVGTMNGLKVVDIIKNKDKIKFKQRESLFLSGEIVRTVVKYD